MSRMSRLRPKKISAPVEHFQPPPGSILLRINLDVPIREMRNWSAQRITKFFGGLAKIIAAKCDEEPKNA